VRQAPAHSGRRRRWLWWSIPLLAVLLLTPEYVRAYRVHGPSDAPSYVWGEVILVNRAAYDLRIPYTRRTLVSRGSPERGEVILVSFPGQTYDVIRRVIGTPGDTVELRDSRVLLNGNELNYLPLDPREFSGLDERNRIGSVVEQENGAGSTHPITYTPGGCGLASAGPFEVPEGHVFLLGDNRDHCTDSRTIGPVARKAIVGRVVGKIRSIR